MRRLHYWNALHLWSQDSNDHKNIAEAIAIFIKLAPAVALFISSYFRMQWETASKQVNGILPLTFLVGGLACIVRPISMEVGFVEGICRTLATKEHSPCTTPSWH